MLQARESCDVSLLINWLLAANGKELTVRLSKPVGKVKPTQEELVGKYMVAACAPPGVSKV